MTFPIVRGLLSCAEFNYRLGVYDSRNQDSEWLKDIYEREDGFTTSRRVSEDEETFLRPSRKMDILVDRIIMEARTLRADDFAGWMRRDIAHWRARDIAALLDSQYRRGLKHGVRLRDAKKCEEFFSTVRNGNQHPLLFGTGVNKVSSYSLFAYCDLIKHNCNQIYLSREMAGHPASANRISSEIGRAVMEEKEKLYEKRERIKK